MFFIIEKNIHVLIIIYLRGKGWLIMAETNFYVSIYDNYAIINLVCVLFVFVFVRIPRKLNQFFPQKPIMSNKETNKPQTTSQKRNNQRPTMMYIIRRYLK